MSDRSGPKIPNASAAPSTATARKFTPDLIEEEGDGAPRDPSAVHPAPVEDPSAEGETAGAARRNERPHRQPDPPICQLRRGVRPVQKIGPNIRTYDAKDSPSSAVARASHPGSASPSRSRTSPRPVRVARPRRARRWRRAPGACAGGGCAPRTPAGARQSGAPPPSPPSPRSRLERTWTKSYGAGRVKLTR